MENDVTTEESSKTETKKCKRCGDKKNRLSFRNIAIWNVFYPPLLPSPNNFANDHVEYFNPLCKFYLITINLNLI